MKLAIITLGTRDLQFNITDITNFTWRQEDRKKILLAPDKSLIEVRANTGHNNWYFCKSPRAAGKTMLSNVDLWKKSIKWVMIDDFIQHVGLDKNPKDWLIVIVSTDQSETELRHRENDTLYFSELLRDYFENTVGVAENAIVEWSVKEQLTNIDYLYEKFGNEVRELHRDMDTITAAYLFFQGGIDQINQALTLRMIQTFKDKVHQFQKPESAEVFELKFPRIFLKDLSREKLIKHIQDYDFDRVSDSLYPASWVQPACRYLAGRLSLNYKNVDSDLGLFTKLYRKETGDLNVKFPKRLDYSTLAPHNKNMIALKDLYLNLKINYVNKDYSNFLINLFSFSENYFKCHVDKYAGCDSTNLFNEYNNKAEENIRWTRFVEAIHIDLVEHLKAQNIDVSNPNRRAYKEIFIYLLQQNELNNLLTIDELEKIGSLLDTLAGMRNSLVHKMKPVDIFKMKGDMKSIFREEEQFFNLLDRVLNVNGLDYVAQLRTLILHTL